MYDFEIIILFLMAISFVNSTPDVLKMYTPMSSTQGISRKVQTEFLPDSINSYSFTGAKEMRFNIQSNAEIMIGSESYLTMDITFHSSATTAPLLAFLKRTRLEMGGIHSLFSKIEVRSNSTNTMIQEATFYNKYYVCKSRFADVSSGMQLYDGDGYEMENNHADNDGQEAVIQPDSVSRFQQPLFPFQFLNGRILAENSAGISGTQKVQWKLRMQPLMSFLRSNIPLLVLKNGIQVVFTLAPPSDVFFSQNTVAANLTDLLTTNLTYTIDNPRYLCTMVVPSPEHNDQLTNAYRSAKGIFLNIPSYRCIRNGVIVNSTTQNIIMNPGVRSLRRVFAGYFSTSFQENNQSGTQIVFPYINHAHVPIYHGTQEYQWRVGATDFPSRSVRLSQQSTSVDGTVGPSLLAQALTLSHVAETYLGVGNSQWSSYLRSPLTIYPEAAAYIDQGLATVRRPCLPGWYVQDFSRDNGNGSELTGIDCSVTPLEFHATMLPGFLVRAFVPTAADQPLWTSGNLEFVVFAEHDQFVRISSEGIVVMN